MQDGIDLISALARHPETARRLARKLWNFFVTDFEVPAPSFVETIAGEYLRNNTEMKPIVRPSSDGSRGASWPTAGAFSGVGSRTWKLML